MSPSTPPHLSQVPSAEALPLGHAAGLGLEGAVWAFLGEDRFSKGPQRWHPQLSSQDPTAVRVPATPSRLILLLEAPSHPPLFRASHGP